MQMEGMPQEIPILEDQVEELFSISLSTPVQISKRLLIQMKLQFMVEL
jgi:hypothetical protein